MSIMNYPKENGLSFSINMRLIHTSHTKKTLNASTVYPESMVKKCAYEQSINNKIFLYKSKHKT